MDHQQAGNKQPFKHSALKTGSKLKTIFLLRLEYTFVMFVGDKISERIFFFLQTILLISRVMHYNWAEKFGCGWLWRRNHREQCEARGKVEHSFRL